MIDLKSFRATYSANADLGIYDINTETSLAFYATQFFLSRTGAMEMTVNTSRMASTSRFYMLSDHGMPF
jgi:hypothetical protein